MATARRWPRSAHLTEQDLLPTEQVVDSGYVSGKHLAESAAAEIDLVGPPLADTSPNGFKIADFTLDHAARQAICPAVRRPPNGRSAASATAVTRSRSASGRRLRRLPAPAPVHRQQGRPQPQHLRALRPPRRSPCRGPDPGLREKLKTRAGIEATLSELVRAHGLRRHRYRGDAKRHFEHLLKAAACNVKRLARALATLQHGPFLPPPLTRPAGALP
ncbi:MAG: transposase [Chloroflexota bacterium]